MQGDIALAGFMLTAAEWEAMDAPSRALLLAIAAAPEELAREHRSRVRDIPRPVLAEGSAPIDER